MPTTAAPTHHGTAPADRNSDGAARAEIDSPIGRIRVTATSEGVTSVSFLDADADEIAAPTPDPSATDPAARDVADRTADELRAYFDGSLTRFTVPTAARGTDFQRRVWRELVRIPHGEVRSYGQLASTLGQPGAARAVGRANATNPIAIIVPCHRVAPADGSTGGFGGGPWRKRWLLDHEASGMMFAAASATGNDGASRRG